MRNNFRSCLILHKKYKKNKGRDPEVKKLNSCGKLKKKMLYALQKANMRTFYTRQITLIHLGLICGKKIITVKSV